MLKIECVRTNSTLSSENPEYAHKNWHCAKMAASMKKSFCTEKLSDTVGTQPTHNFKILKHRNFEVIQLIVNPTRK